MKQICKSVKSAETRSLDLGMEDAIYMSKMMHELYTGKSSDAHHMPVEMITDSKTLYDTIQSSKQIDEKTMRHILAWIKQTGVVDKSYRKYEPQLRMSAVVE